MRKYGTSQKIWAVVLTLVMVLGMSPVPATAVAADHLVRTADPSTMNDYQALFVDPDTVGVTLSTENAGGVWTDKSVFAANNIPAELTGATSDENTNISMTDNGDNFLVALSAVASNKEIVGYSTQPTDTMFVLDLSGSMGMSSNPGYVRNGNQYTQVTHYDHTMVAAMIEATNNAIHRLLTLNKHNRVGVVLYSGNSQVGASNADTAQLLLPLGRYDAVEGSGNGAVSYEYLEYALTRATNTLYTRSGNRYTSIGQRTYTTAITASVKNGLKTEAGGNVTDASKVTLGGTYIQNGLYKAWQEFADADTVIADGSIQSGATRMPIMVLMSDGAPTTATHLYTGSGTTMGTSTAGTGQSTTAGIAFLTQLTAAWTRAKMEEHYVTTPKFYTLGLDTGSDYDTSVLDPANSNNNVKNYWNTYLTLGTGTMNLTDLPNTNNMDVYHTSTIGKDALVNEMVYVDEYFPADSAQEMIDAFQSIVDEIILQSKYYPTFVEKDHDHDGYVTFTDKIGGYMEVTDMHGIVIGDTLYSGALLARGFGDGSIFGTVDNPTDLGDELVRSVKERLGIADTAVARQLLQNAYTYGQLSYTSDTEFSNYIGWYSDAAGNYLDFWHEGITSEPPIGATHIIKSYGMLGNTDTAHGIAAADMMYASIRVSQEIEDQDGDGISGETLVTWQIPASLVPTITYMVKAETNAAGEITGVTSVELENANVKPIRLLYEVALRDDITEWNIAEEVNDGYKNSTDNKDAGYVFYTNQWKKESGTTDTTRNTYSHFEPSLQNEWYYYTEDAIIYTDDNGTVYTGASAPSTSGTYYRAYQVYEKLETGTYRMHTHYEQISAESLAAAEKSGSNWVIPKGTVFRFWDPFQEAKISNETNTHAYAEYPTITYDGVSGHYYALDVLGNNGKLTVTPATGITVTKTIDEVVAGASDTFTFVISGGSGEATLIRLDSNGDEASRETLTFTAGSAEFTISADETVYIIGLEDGVDYTVSEKGNEHYNISSVTVNGAAVSGKTAQITAVSHTIQSAAFVNSPKGYGDLFITKAITSSHTVPGSIQNQSFAVTVNVGTELAGKEFTVNATDMVNGGIVTTTETVAEDGTILLTIVHGQTYQIVDLPEGAMVTVTENLTSEQQTYFTGTIKTRDYTGAEQDTDNQVTIHKDANSTAILTNAYVPKSTTVDLDVAGKKVFTIDQPLSDAIEFTFKVRRWNGSDWEDVATKTASVEYAAGESGEKAFAITDVLEGITYTEATVDTYQIIEVIGTEPGVTYDTAIHTVTVTVTDNGGQLVATVTGHHTDSVHEYDGKWTATPTFTNTYDTAGVSIDVVKSVVDTSANPETSKAGFSFIAVETDELWQPLSGGMTKTEISDGAGEARFTATYKDPGTHYFVITERNDGKTNWTYDDTEYRVKIVITEETDGNLTAAMEVITVAGGVESAPVAYGNSASIAFENTYDPDNAEVDLDIVPTVVKHLEGRALAAGEFTFAIFEDGQASHTDTTNAIVTGTNDASGDVTFNDKLYFDKVGTYHYDVVEITGSLGGVSYDTTIYDMVVEVTDVAGTLQATYYFEDSVTEQVAFNNSYNAADTEIVLSGTKTLTGRPLVNAEFRFDLVEIVSDTDTTAKVGGVKLTAESDPDNDNNGTTQFSFPAIEYTTTGTYYYLITEQGAGTTNMGVTYSDAQYIVKVTVTDPGDGQLVASSQIVSGGSELAFTNLYVPQGTSANLSSSKQLTGRVMKDGEFEFTLTEKTDSTYATDKAGGVKETVKNDGSGKIIFSTLQFNAAGDYYYVIGEAAGSAGGVTYDTTKYNVHISVVDNHKGQLVATTTMTRVTEISGVVTETPATVIEFYNTYTIDGEGDLSLKGNKVYNQTLSGGEFEFGLFDDDGNLIEKVSNAADGSFAFTALKYDETDVDKTYTYLVEEILPVVNGNELSIYQGITYDTTVYTVVVTITDNGEGGITVSHTINGAAAPIVFTNNYSVTGNDTVPLGGTKTMNGDRTAVAAGEFEFGLYDGVNLLQKVAVKADGTFAFEDLRYEAADIRSEPYIYTVQEIVPAGAVLDPISGKNVYNGITYDSASFTVAVTVRDNGAGGVEASATVNGSAYNQIAFTNQYEAAPVDYILEAAKTYTKPLKGDDFTFLLEGTIGSTEVEQAKKNDASGKIVFDKLTFTEAGTYTFTVTEIDKILGFIDYSKEVYTVKITVRDNGIGELHVTDVTVTDSNGNPATDILFQNTYILDGEAEITLYGTKALTGFRTQLQDKEFAFGLYDGAGNLVQTTYNDTLGNFVFNTLVFDESYVGQTLTYTVKEILPVVDGAEVTEYEGRTYDTAVYTVVVNVKDNEVGGVVVDYTINGAVGIPITFSNRYEVEPAVVQLEGTKSYNRPLNGNDFTFTLTGEGQNQIKQNDAEGKIVFDELTFTEEGTYEYTIKEIDKVLGFINYSTAEYEVIVEVTDNNKGQLIPVVTVNDVKDGNIAFTNTYILDGEDEIVLEGTKVYNETLEGDDFTFELLDAQGNVLQTKTNDADGKIAFDKLTFGVDDLGVHIFYVEEVLPKDEHGHELSVYEGITYDTHVYTVEVIVFDNGAGQVVATYTVDKEADKDIVFTNDYSITGHDTVGLKGTKAMIGDRNTVAAGEFTFGLYYTDGSEALDKDGNHIVATNDANGNFAFPTLYYNENHLGAHNYLIKEIIPGTNPADGITYDTTVYEVEVHVVDNGAGGVDASYTVNGSAHTQLAFTNSYKHEPVGYKLQAEKVYEKGLKGNDFTFTLTGEGFATQTKKNDAEGNVYFDELTFTDNGEYTFTITETDKLLGFISYSTEVYTVKITVTDNGKGNLVVTDVEVTDSKGNEATDMIFVNTYVITGTDEIILTGNKTLTGDRTTVAANEFAFGLYNASGSLLEKKYNDAAGNFAFSALTFDKDDIGKNITYTVKEIIPDGDTKGIDYDETVYTVKVTVVDNNEGGVTATYTLTGGDEIAFTNNYTARDVKVQLEGTKIYDKPLAGNDFTFTLTGEGFETQTKKNDADGKIKFDELTFTEVGKYEFTVTETDKFLGFVEYSKATYKVVIDVTDNGEGELEAAVTVNGQANGKIVFVNSYVLDGEDIVILRGTKVYNQTLTGKVFRFGLYDGNGNLLQTAHAMEDGSISFAPLHFNETHVGNTYTYLVEEILPVVNGHEVDVHHGITYDTTVYTVKVTVNDNGVGGVDAVNTVDGADKPIVFTNNYSVTGNDNLHLEGVKYITGDRTELLEGETYTFELIDSNGNVVETATSDENGKFAFTDILFEEKDIRVEPYIYTVSEQIPSGDTKGVAYDATVYEVEVYVMDDGMGGVEVSHTINNHGHDHLIFTNSYAADDAKVNLVGTKTYDKGLSGNDFTFVLKNSEGEVIQTKKNDADGKIVFDKLTFTDEGVYNYVVEETDKVLGFINYSSAVYEIEITVSDNDHGELEAEVLVNTVKDGKIEFVNEYQYLDADDEITLSGTKTISGYRDTVNEKEFSFGLYLGTDEIDVAEVKADGTFVFDTLTYDVDDLGTYTYTVKEILPVVDGEEVTEHEGRTYDDTIYTVVVTVEDDGEGHVVASYTVDGDDDKAITFANEYNVEPAKVNLEATKSYDKGLKGDDFTFTLTGEIDGVKVEQTKKNDKDGNIYFDELTFEKAGTYTFTVKEVDKVLGFINYSTAEYEVVIEVTDNDKGVLETEIVVNTVKDGKIEFVNTYILDGEDSIVIDGTKQLTGDRALAAEEFSFGLYDAEGKLVETVKNGEDGKFAFAALTFDETYIGEDITYTVKEILPVDEKGEEMTLAMGVTYDTTVYTVDVEVKDNEEGGVEASWTIVDAEKISFVNDYQDPDPVSVELNVLKNVINKNEPGIGLDGFEFELTYDDEVVKTVKSDDDGKAGFTASFDVDHAGSSYVFEISEVKGSATGVTYDTTVHTITVDVVRNADGSLKTLINGEEADEITVEFTNTYEEPSTPVTGDNFHLILIVVLLGVSAAGIIVILMMKKSRKGGKYAR